MKFNLSIFALFLYFLSFGQSLTTDFTCTYTLEYKDYGKPKLQQFIMFIDSKHDASYFLPSNTYVKDTVKTADPMLLASLDSDFEEKIYRAGNEVTTFENVKDINIRQQENINLKWTLLPKTKKMETLTLRLAETTAFGRKWQAWYSTDIPINFGPYKFFGLPGFIVSVISEDGDYVFTLDKFKKKKRTVKLPLVKNYKLISTEDFNKVRYKIQTADDGVVIFQSGEERKKWNEGLVRFFSKRPLLDIRYPKE